MLIACACLAPSAAVAQELVVPTSSLGALGWRRGAAPLRAARSDLAGGLSSALVRLVDGSEVQSSAASERGRALRSDAFVFSSQAAARYVLSAWRSAHRARVVALGQGGLVATQTTRMHSLATVVWREGSRIGVLELRARRGVDPESVALEFARLGDSELVAPLPRSAWDRITDEIRPNGSVSVQTALQAFALTYGPLPGIRVPAGSRALQPSGDLAADWILPDLPRLSSRLRNAVDRDLGVTSGGTVARAADYGDSGFHPSIAMTLVATSWAAIYGDSAHLDVPLRYTIVAGTTTTPVPGAYADARPVDATGRNTRAGPYCRIRLGPLAGSLSSSEQSLVLAHETFHCFEVELSGVSVPAWITEGLAEWAAVSVDPSGSPFSERFINMYITTPHTSLFRRTYDAIGFYGHAEDALQQAGGSLGLWPQLHLLVIESDREAYETAGGGAEDFLSTWGSSVFRSETGGSAWRMISPEAPTNVPVPTTDIGDDEAVAAPAYTTSQYRLFKAPGDPLVYVLIRGHARLSTVYNYTHLDGSWFCTEESCECPPGTEGTVPPSSPLGSGSDLGLTGDPGDPGGTAGEVLYFPLSHFCHKPTPPPGGGGSMQCGGSDCASSGGDPHLFTFDGDAYDFQAAGEFTLLKSTTDDLEIQEREQPFQGSRYVAVNTAVAIRVARAIVEVDVNPLTSRVVLWVDRRRVKVEGSLRLAGGGRVSTLAGATVIVTWPDGTEAVVAPGLGADVAVKVAARRDGHLTGLLGDAGVASTATFAGRDGRHYSAEVLRGATPADFKQLYKSFGQSWRVSRRDSLFVYPRGKNTSSYTIKGFPGKPYTVLSLSPTALASGERTCAKAGVRDPAVLGGCVLDVGATGHAGFAAGAARLQGLTGGPPGSAGGISPVAWTKLSSQPDDDQLLIASLAPAGTNMVAAYARGARAIETATFTPTAGGVGAVTRTTPFTGALSVGDPLLFPAPGGEVQMIFSAISNTATLNGTLIAQRQPNGLFAAPQNTNSGADAHLARGAVLASDGVTPVWTNTYGPFMKLERGASSPHETDLSSLVAGDAYVPTLAHDHSGRLWMAWYEIANNPARSGLYLIQLDPSGGGVAPGTRPQLAPDSQTIDNNTAQPALACATVCRLVYQDTSTPTQLDSWTPGQARPVAIASDRLGFSDPTAAYNTDGRLWVTWTEPHSRVLLAKLGNATGAGGNPILTQTPPGYKTALNTASAVNGTQLVLATNWQADSNTPATAVFATLINAGE
jgi:von Willebrand factor type D domain